MFYPSDPLIDAVLRGLILSAVSLMWVVLLVRIVGLRSFSKMTNFDFVMTVAMGSLVAGGSQATEGSALAQVFAAMVGLFVTQYISARLRRASDNVEALIQNEPVMLMRDGVFIERALDETRVSKADIYAKLREANVLEMRQIRAVILETTGDISVLHGDRLEHELLREVRNAGPDPADEENGAA